MKKICVFDVNETLLDLSVLDSEFERIFGSASVRKEWFGQFIQSALVTIVTDSYQPFGVVGAAAFDMIAERHGIVVSQEDKKALLSKIAQLPPHPEVAKNLARLKEHGYAIAALTNSTLEVAEKQLQNAGIARYFDKILSADSIQQLKPSKAVYQMTAKAFDVETQDIRLIAAHAWDIAGARHAGCATAFIARPGMVLDPLFEKPDIFGGDLREVVDQIIEADV
ncbi:MAG TPA: haloacid dehalogenase type II [Candidatus Saccharimonadales bacterium]|nr:haloacid dehalogenase type II [Candidatus Saccharimonadales bacterium]